MAGTNSPVPATLIETPPSQRAVAGLPDDSRRASPNTCGRRTSAGVEAAYHFAAQAHSGQFRISGEPYITHPVAVTELVAGWRPRCPGAHRGACFAT